MNWELAKTRLARLRNRSAAPAYFAFAWAGMGHWSRIEFVFRKMSDFAAQPIAQAAMVAAGIGWLGWLIIRGESKADSSKARLEAIRGLLREASAAMKANRRGDFESVHTAAANHFNVLMFLDRAFKYRVKLEYLQFSKEEGGKWRDAGSDFPVDQATAQYLEELADRITLHDLDFGFYLPETYEQFRETESWMPNRRPEPRPQ